MKSSFEAFPQAGGLMWVVETHVDDVGREHFIRSLQSAKADPTEWLDANAETIAATLSSSEAVRNAELKLSGRGEEMSFDYSDEKSCDVCIEARKPEIEAQKIEADAKADVAAAIVVVKGDIGAEALESGAVKK